EQLGIAAYVVNKSNLKPSDITSNLYVQIANTRGEVLKQEVLLVEGGVASSVYDIDSDFLPGDYTITAFTNWMRNFDEQNYFTEKIKVLESSTDFQNPYRNSLGTIDAQFLPESGHLLNNVMNHVGIIVRDSHGHGVPNAIVQVKGGKGEIIDSVELNEFGIGKFSFIPNQKERYSAVVIIKGKGHRVDFRPKVEGKGILLFATQRNAELRLQIITNSKTLEFGKRDYILSVQGTNALETYPINFEKQKNIPLIFNFSKMDPGVNIFTLFDEDLLPVAERMVFNYTGLPVDKINKPKIQKKGDTLEFNMSFDTTKDRKFSIAILPKNTLSYNRNHDIISYNFLQPYVKAAVESGGWYFEDIDNRKKYELDNLLLTQGWSSYDWTSIFESKGEMKYPEENNFSFEAQIVNKRIFNKDQRYIVHATSINPIDYFVIPQDNNTFIYDGFKALEGDTLAMSRLRKNDDLLPAGLNLRFFPNKIPFFHPNIEALSQKIHEVDNTSLIAQPAFKDDEMKNFEELEEVIIETTRNKDQERERKLNRSAFGTIAVITEGDIRAYPTLAQFLRSRGLQVVEETGSFKVFSRGSKMAVFIDEMPALDGAVLNNYSLVNVDYVDIDKSGINNSVWGGNGSIKIYRDVTGRHSAFNGRTRIQEFEIPLGYSRKKSFYRPKYANTSDQFFQKFGVIDWKPHLHSENGEDTSFFIPTPEVDFELIIEGFTTNGDLIHEVHSFQINNEI
ncbi:MAG: hypothetical protein WBL21_11885, partial [Salinimicrobium sp.]